MYATHPLMVINACAKHGKSMSNIKECYGPDTKRCQKPCKFDLEVKCQHCIGIMNLRNTSSHGDTPMATGKYGKPMSDQKTSYVPDTNLHRQMDRQTEGQSDFYIPPELHSWWA